MKTLKTVATVMCCMAMNVLAQSNPCLVPGNPSCSRDDFDRALAEQRQVQQYQSQQRQFQQQQQQFQQQQLQEMRRSNELLEQQIQQQQYRNLWLR